MKKNVYFLFAILLVLTFVSCVGNKNQADATDATSEGLKIETIFETSTEENTVIQEQTVYEQTTQEQTAQEETTEETATEYELETFDGVCYLGREGLKQVAPGKNVIVFLIDRFDEKYYQRVIKSDSEYFDCLDGFTYFEDNISYYTATYPAICSIITGVKQDFSVTANEYFSRAYNTSDFLADLAENDFAIRVYTDTYYAYRDQTNMCKYIENAHIAESIPEGEDYKINDFELCETLMSGLEFQGIKKANAYIFYHLNGCHYPVQIDENCNADGDASVMEATKGCFKMIYAYIEELKRLGVYDNATIIVTGDHSAGGTDENAAPVNGTALFIKPANSKTEGLAKSTAQVCDDMLIPTVIKSAGIKTDRSYGKTYFDITEDEVTSRYMVRFQTDSEGTHCNHYTINGPWRDKSNWTMVYETTYHGFYR